MWLQQTIYMAQLMFKKLNSCNPNHPPTISMVQGFAHYVKELKSELDEKVLIMDGGNFSRSSLELLIAEERLIDE